MASESRFWDRLATKYAAQPVADEAAYQTKLAKTREYLRPDMDVLEFGCGTGSTAISHAPFVATITATDFSDRMLEIARDKAAAAGASNITFEKADIAGFDAGGRTYDVVLCLSLLHLLKDRQDAIRRVHAVLKPGGLFVSSTTCLGDTLAAFKFLAPIGKAVGLLPQLNVMTRADLTADIAAAGFAIEHEWQPAKDKAVFIIARKAA